MCRTDIEVLIKALRILVEDIQSEDGVANACIAEGADRLEEYHIREIALKEALDIFSSKEKK